MPDDNTNENPEEQNENQDTNDDKDTEIIDSSDSLFGEKDREITTEMQESYLDYAMSVIVQRALPDVRDGMKPVHRRILFSMHELGLRANAKYRKSALVVGDVLGKYHPHGDSAVYDSMVRMAQDFAMRHILVEGQGNFGSLDGDSPAAMRYTEAKMTKISEEMLSDIEKETITWADNYDGSRKEPTVLPTKVPQLLLNGTMGIAVGMATNIPPHNLGEIIDALQAMINNPEIAIDELMQYIKGPDFPTGGVIYDKEAIKAMYVNGRGGIVVRGRAKIIDGKKGKLNIIISEIPYQVNKSALVTKIADLVRDKKIIGISDIRDESNKEGIRISIELKKEAFPKKILNQIYKLTPLQTSFNMNMIALVDGIQPQLLNLKQVLYHFINHRVIVITNRTKYELKVAKARAHILEGLKIALDNIDEVIDTIRKSDTKEIAAKALMEKFNLSEIQATEILAMRLQTLAGLERKKIEDEYKEKMALIEELESILADPEKIKQIIRDELNEIKTKYANDRRTEINPNQLGKFSQKDTIPNEPMIIMLSEQNYIKRIPQAIFRSQNRGGKGVIGVTTKDEDEIKSILFAKNHDDILYFTNLGRVFTLPVFEIVEAKKMAKGQPIVNLLKLQKDEKVTAMFKIQEDSYKKYLVMATIGGTVKKTEIEAFKNIRQNGLLAIKLKDGDYLNWVKESGDKDEVILVTINGKCILFPENNIRSMRRISMGVRGIKLKNDDQVVEMEVSENPEESKLVVVTENGLGKSTELVNYRNQRRGGSGIKTANVTAKTGPIMKAEIIHKDQEGDIIIISRQGQTIRLNLKDIPDRGRSTQGVYLMRMKNNDKIASISIINKEDEGEETPPEVNEKQQDLFALSKK